MCLVSWLLRGQHLHSTPCLKCAAVLGSPQWDGTQHTVYSWVEVWRRAPISGCSLPMGPWWLHLNNCIQEIHPHRPLPGLYVPPPTGPQTCSGQDIAWQGRSNLLRCDRKGPGNIRHIRQALINNGDPRGVLQHHATPAPTRPADDHSRGPVITLPYVRGLSEAVRWVLTPLGLRVSFHPNTTLKQPLVRPKDWTPTEELAEVVYQVPCVNCPASYVGQTGRCLGKRMKDHRKAVESGDCANSALAEHTWSHHHPVDWDKVRLLEQQPRLYHRLTLESIHIRSHPHILNRNNGTLSPVYNSLFLLDTTSVPYILPDPTIPAPLSLFITCHLTCCHSHPHWAPYSMHCSLYEASHSVFYRHWWRQPHGCRSIWQLSISFG